jgi:hypothetical protein
MPPFLGLLDGGHESIVLLATEPETDVVIRYIGWPSENPQEQSRARVLKNIPIDRGAIYF